MTATQYQSSVMGAGCSIERLANLIGIPVDYAYEIMVDESLEDSIPERLKARIIEVCNRFQEDRFGRMFVGIHDVAKALSDKPMTSIDLLDHFRAKGYENCRISIAQMLLRLRKKGVAKVVGTKPSKELGVGGRGRQNLWVAA